MIFQHQRGFVWDEAFSPGAGSFVYFGPRNGLHIRWWEWEEIQFLPCVLFLVLSFDCCGKKMMMKMAVKSVYSQSVRSRYERIGLETGYPQHCLVVRSLCFPLAPWRFGLLRYCKSSTVWHLDERASNQRRDTGRRWMAERLSLALSTTLFVPC